MARSPVLRLSFQNLKLRFQFIAATTVVLACLLGQATFAYQTAAESRDAVAWVDHSQHVIQLADEAEGALVEMENAYRGFMVAGRIEFFEPFQAGRWMYLSRLAALKRETTDDPAQIHRWVDLEQREEQWEREVTIPGMTLRWQVAPGGRAFDPIIEGSVVDRAQFEAMRQVFGEAVASEQSLLARRTDAAAAANRQLQVVLVWGTVAAGAVGLLVALLVARSINGGLRPLVRATEQIMRGDLSQRIRATRRDELGDASAAFDRMAQELEESSNRRETLLHVFRQLAADDDTERVLSDLLLGAIRLVHATGAAVFRWDPEQECLAAVGCIPEVDVSPCALEVAHQQACEAVELRQACITNRGMAVPLAHQGQTVGALAAWSTESDRVFGAMDAAGLEILGAVGAATLSRHQQAALLRHHAETDALTGLVNRRKAAETLDELLRRAEHHEQSFALAIVDLDYFKQLNDRCGHEMGDRVLQRVSELLERSFRAEDLVARWGGEEFVIGLHAATREDAAWRLEFVLDMLAADEVATPDGDVVRVTFSAGVAQYPGDGATLLELMRAADAALYKAKQSGRARVTPAEARAAAA
jgi:diguanylate cyclase (GGDEF)-like protein